MNNTSSPTPAEAMNCNMSNMTNPFFCMSITEILEITAPQIILIDRIVSPIWYIIGLIGNPISAVIWLSRKICKTNSSAVYFGSLAIVETIYLVLHFIQELEFAWGVKTYGGKTTCELFNFLYITPQYLVPMLVLGFTTERYIAVCHPFVKEKYCTVTRAKIVIICMSALSVAIALLQIYIWAWDDKIGCVFRPDTEKFNEVWTWFTEMLLFGFIPVSCLVINILVILEIRRLSVQSAAHGQGQTSGNAASTTTLLCVSFYFICTLLPATIVYAIQPSVPQGDVSLPVHTWSDDPVWSGYFSYLTIRKIVEEICLSNYATYFIIYYATGVYFRREFRSLFGLKKKRKSKGVSSRGMLSDYSIVQSNGRNTSCTETMLVDSPSDT
ncbi:neurotensin receptor type 1-like [Mercenaria mercenaria]|uniref:neurotensin receptor type 1-like n=1 Tax=Mercenaria mercenaria TaxID=6596 RepID=UPI00234F970F|nr:neurotensin receptor type 1-like [Mercenaria mercenaria]XP_045156754.2 neurotensin receptor type 1-like [Mercenaria mercenaria]XP_045156755.2 neurotensin receptor type 1-like [Mercenaria mercenaria]XP_045156756.2 neurotensin receptor type 1-like [Mercenaria mercenaria]XP_045156757.2 neurotensin receptor type 1-like [Mercenaria mercenaria]XP_045156759.2 neurotensin receptor type 1-like [Mercenaria mercenaria]XP_045156760.2 neurotensin receptor type 1-like [Mercenaria mercenaria]XP_04515676